ncbi:hypothetical protein [Parasitella parasitica]|uniref:Uncharacterized protein n=1 Tax=Parasitella parasitica TaxID=35722 RepID=A0A0B7NW69_9FUNG|nr:hypothetical protein [Parasitella parasitica]
MPLFKSKRNNQITSEFDTVSQSALLPIQNVYSAYNRLPSPVLTVDQSPENVYRSSNIRNNHHYHHHQKPNENTEQDTAEKFSQQQILIKEAEERAPQIVLTGGNGPAFNYSVYNSNYFELNFEKIKTVMYYPPALNVTTIGIGEISDLTLRPHAVTNVTFSVQLFSDAGNNFNNMDKTTTINTVGKNGSSFESLVEELCLEGGKNESESTKEDEIKIVYELMPTLRFGDYGTLSMLLTEQALTVSCEKLQNMAKQP